MGNLIGSRSQFGIEYEILPGERAGASWMFGKCCYWIAGEMVGDYELGTSLGDVLTAFPWIVGDTGKRDEPRLFKLPAREAIDVIEGICQGDIPEGHSLFVDTAARFRIKPIVDVFDGVDVYCISEEGVARLIWTSEDCAAPKEATCPADVVDSAVLGFYEVLCALERQFSE